MSTQSVTDALALLAAISDPERAKAMMDGLAKREADLSQREEEMGAKAEAKARAVAEKAAREMDKREADMAKREADLAKDARLLTAERETYAAAQKHDRAEMTAREAGVHVQMRRVEMAQAELDGRISAVNEAERERGKKLDEREAELTAVDRRLVERARRVAADEARAA